MGNCRPFRRGVATAPEPAAPAPYGIVYLLKWAQHPIAGQLFTSAPRGVILHGSHSGIARTTAEEFESTANYGVVTDYAYHRTIGDDIVAKHLNWNQKGWHARACSQTYLGMEFAQPGANGQNEEISDAQVHAFCAEFIDARKMWPSLPMHFPTHAEVDGTAEYGGYHDGKWDVFSKTDSRAEALRARIFKRLRDQYGVTS